jgi:hypothetical protein
MTGLLIALISLLPAQPPALRLAVNQRFLETAEGKPFFWLGDTGWLLSNARNAWGKTALMAGDPGRPDAAKASQGESFRWSGATAG